MMMTMINLLGARCSLGVAGSFWGAFTCRVSPSVESDRALRKKRLSKASPAFFLTFVLSGNQLSAG
jgi:hypothetical protein